MAEDDKNPPVRMYEQRMRFTPDGTQFSNELTKEGREHVKELHEAKMQREAADARKNTVREEFAKRARVNANSKTNFRRASSKDRDDFER